jgi:hypothetical protein
MKRWTIEKNAHPVLLHANHLAQTHNDAVKTFRRVVVHQLVRVHHDKRVMAQIHAEQDLRRWIAINRVCVHVFSNRIFQKM